MGHGARGKGQGAKGRGQRAGQEAKIPPFPFSLSPRRCHLHTRLLYISASQAKQHSYKTMQR